MILPPTTHSWWVAEAASAEGVVPLPEAAAVSPAEGAVPLPAAAVAPAEEAVAPPAGAAAAIPAVVAVATPAVVAAPPAAVAVATLAAGAVALPVVEAEVALVVPLLLPSRSEEAARGVARGDPTVEGALGVVPVTVTTDPRLVAKLVTMPGVVTGRAVASTVASVPRRSEP